jgi:hypothetical protein
VTPQFGASLIGVNYAPRAVNYAPRVVNIAPRVVNYSPRDSNQEIMNTYENLQIC